MNLPFRSLPARVVRAGVAWIGGVLAVVSLAGLAGRAHAQGENGVPPIVIGVVAPERPEADLVAEAVDRAVRQGATMVAEEFGLNATMLGIDFGVPIGVAADAATAVAEAQRLVDEEGAFALVGGWGGLEIADALSEWSAERGVPFLNAGESADVLRNEACKPTTFHVEPSDAMYLDAMAGWYVRSGFRRWFVLRSDDARGEALHERARWSLNERHFGVRIVGDEAVADTGEVEEVARRIRRANADLIVLLLSAEEQLGWLTALEGEGLELPVAAHADAETQTRTFMAASRDAAPTLGAGQRILAFEATLDAYGAREINARYRARWEEPMDPPAWAAYQAVKILYEAAFFGRSTAASDVLGRLTAEGAVFDLWKGIGATFRPWDRQLRQSMYLVEIREQEPEPFRLGLLVGELPAIYLPGTDPTERLDQIGDLANRSDCRR